MQNIIKIILFCKVKYNKNNIILQIASQLVFIIQATNNQQTHKMSLNTSAVHITSLETRKRAVLEQLSVLPPADTDLQVHFANTAPLYAEYAAFKHTLAAIYPYFVAAEAPFEQWLADHA